MIRSWLPTTSPSWSISRSDRTAAESKLERQRGTGRGNVQGKLHARLEERRRAAPRRPERNAVEDEEAHALQDERGAKAAPPAHIVDVVVAGTEHHGPNGGVDHVEAEVEEQDVMELTLRGQ